MEEAEGSDKRILIIEDEMAVVSTLEVIIEKLGHGVMGVAQTGHQAIKLLDASDRPPDLVLVDITLKGPVDGIETAINIQDRWEVPVMYITGNQDPETIDRAIDKTLPVAFLQKPFSPKMLRSLITEALDSDGLFSNAPLKGYRRNSERLPIPLTDHVQVFVGGADEGVMASLKNLSMSGAGFVSEDKIITNEYFEISITPQADLSRISGFGRVRYAINNHTHYYYGAELDLNSDNHKNLAAYYSYLNNKWYSAN